MKIIDGFLFFNEFDILKLRLSYLNEVVDHFVILESNYTFSGKLKPYYLDEIFDDIPDKIKNKIIRLKYEPDINQFCFPKNVNECDLTNDHWKLENEQRKYFEYALKNFSSDDLFMLSDVDEIPRKELIQNFKNNQLSDNFCCVANCLMFYYNFTTFNYNNWPGTIFSNTSNFLQKGCDYFRNQRFKLPSINEGGWHFSYFGDIEKIKQKLESFSHQEYNKEKYKSSENIINSINNKKDLLHRGEKFEEYDVNNFPKELYNLIVKIFPKQFYETKLMTNSMNFNASGATETSYFYLQEHYSFPENVFVSHLPDEIKKSNHQYKILWAHHAYDQPVFLNFDHNIVDHIVSPSQWNKEQFIRYLNVPEHKITVIPNGVDKMFSHSNQKTKTMIFTSIPYKGLEVLAKIIPMIQQIHPDTKFKIFSSMSLYGPSQDPYLELYDHLKTLKNVEYSAVIDREQLVKHYQESAFFIHPNIWEETFCVSMTEAMRCGAYPIITDIGALAEVAGEKNATVVPIEGTSTTKGYQVTENFLVNFANACCLALSYYDKEPQYYQEVSKLISDYVVEKYDWKKIADKWELLINNLIQNEFTSPTYYCMVNTHNTEEYTDLAIDTFFKNTKLKDSDRFFLIDNDGQYHIKNNKDSITLISNPKPKSFAQNMNFIMKLALIDRVNFFGLNNDLVFTQNWNQGFNNGNKILVPLCNQKLIGESGDLKIDSAMNLEDFIGKEKDLDNFVKNIDTKNLNIDKTILGYHCFYVPFEILSKVGFFDENFENGGEDVDYRLRASQLGFETDINTSSYLLHFYGKSIWRCGEEKEKTLDREKKYRNYFEKKWGINLANQLLVKSSVS